MSDTGGACAQFAVRSGWMIRCGCVLAIGLSFIAEALLPSRPRESVAVALCSENLRKIGRAIEAYYDQHRAFPPAYVNGLDGEPAHSWRVLLLPHLGRQDLYDSYDFDEPWNSASNIRLANQMPDVFACPGATNQSRGCTNYVAVVGSQTAWPGDQGIRGYSAFRDGTSRTIRLIEISHSDIGWTEPRDVWMHEIIHPNAGQHRNALESPHRKLTHVLMCDGRVVSPETIPTGRVLFTLLTQSGGDRYQGKMLPSELDQQHSPIGDFPPECLASDWKHGDVIPHLNGEIRNDRNYVYCATFQMAWDELRQLVGEDILLDGHPPLATALNESTFPRSSLSPDSYVAMGRQASDAGQDEIPSESGGGLPRPIPSVGHDGEEGALVAYAYLEKHLPFEASFERFRKPLVFRSAVGDAAVASFGFETLSNAVSDVHRQVEVLSYDSDDEFVLRLRPKTDEIMLAKVRPEATLGKTLQAVQRKIERSRRNLDKIQFGGDDELRIPCLRLNVLRSYGELVALPLRNPRKDDWFIGSATQSVRFLLNENGARLESEAEIVMFLDDSPPLPPPPRYFVLDRPFLLSIREANAAQPYLVMWVASPEIMERQQ